MLYSYQMFPNTGRWYGMCGCCHQCRLCLLPLTYRSRMGEYAARATTTTAWTYAVSYDDSANSGEATGREINSNLDAMGWYEFNNERGKLSRTTAGYPSGTKPVAKKHANKWGLYNMVGNVYE